MDDLHSFSTFNYLGEDLMLTQFSILAENVAKALPLGNEGTKAITAQVKCLKSRKEKWPDKIITTWLQRNIPLFSSEAITKLIQAYLSWAEEVNESRRRQKESLHADINRKKKQLDDIDQKRGQTEDTYQSVLLACHVEMSFFCIE